MRAFWLITFLDFFSNETDFKFLFSDSISIKPQEMRILKFLLSAVMTAQ